MLRRVQLRAKCFEDSDFAIIIYIPQYDKHANCQFSFMNVGFFIAANVRVMSVHRLTRILNRLYIPQCDLNRAEKETFKWIQNEFYDLKSNSCHVIR